MRLFARAGLLMAYLLTGVVVCAAWGMPAAAFAQDDDGSSYEDSSGDEGGGDEGGGDEAGGDEGGSEESYDEGGGSDD